MATRPDDDFAAAFESFSKGEPPAVLDTDPAAAPPADDTQPTGGGDDDAGNAGAGASGADDAPAGGAPGGDDGAGAPADDGDGSASAPAAATPPAAPAETPDDILQRLAAAVREQAPAAPPQQAPATDQPEQAPLYTQAEIDQITAYQSEYADVAQAEQLIRRSEYNQLLNYMFQQVASILTPMQAQLQTVATRMHLSDLHEDIPEYDTERDKVLAWVETEPPYLQAGYKYVIEQGSPEEVKDLFRRYWDATGRSQQQQPPVQTPKVPPQTELPSPAKQAAQALAPVRTQRSGVPQQDDPQDFDRAFERAAAGQF